MNKVSGPKAMNNSNFENCDPREKVGEAFNEDDFLRAQKRGWEALYHVAQMIKPGMVEADAKKLLKEVLIEFSSEKIWHPPQVRFGVNTVLPFSKPQLADHVLKEDDVFFLDIGPVFDGYESDIGETFQLGSNPKTKKLISDSKEIFKAVKTHWKSTGVNGEHLYEFATGLATERGWKLALEGASGHRISEFPHAAHYRGKLKTFELVPTQSRWILEIHLIDTDRKIGAFFEDVL
jgi:methionyl aminopeptidase